MYRLLLQYDVMSDLGNLEVGSGSHGGASKRAVSAGSRSPSAVGATATIPEEKEGEEAEQEEQEEEEEEERAAAAAATAAAAAAEDSAAASNQEEVVGTGRCDQQLWPAAAAALLHHTCTSHCLGCRLTGRWVLARNWPLPSMVQVLKTRHGSLR
jgi:hypothetical protein